jgi:hypothetical protein
VPSKLLTATVWRIFCFQLRGYLLFRGNLGGGDKYMKLNAKVAITHLELMYERTVKTSLFKL